MSLLLDTLLPLLVLLNLCLCNVVELGQGFEDVTQLTQPHLVMFYAPWCGHCRTLHPTWHEVATKLSHHPITVAKLDATIYRTVADKFSVRGFPSIRLISSDRTLDYNGDRTTSALFDFALAGSRPKLLTISSIGVLKDLKRTEDVIFVLREPTDAIRDCIKLFVTSIIHETIVTETSNDKIIRVDNTVTPTTINERTDLRPDNSVAVSPGLVVLKDDIVLAYTGDMMDCLEMNSWISAQRFSAFQVGSYPVIHPLLFLQWDVVFYYGEDPSKVSEIKTIARQYTVLPRDFHFIQITKSEYIENLISGYTEVNSIIIYNPTTEQYSYTTNMSLPISILLAEYSAEQIVMYGGTGIWANIKKVLFRLHSNVWPLFAEYPIIMGLVLLIPIGLIALCCCDSRRSKDDPIRHIMEDKSEMDMLWSNDKKEEATITESVEEKDPTLKKDE